MDLLRDDRVLRDAFRRGDKHALLEVYLSYAGEVFAFLKAGFAFRSGDQRFFFNGYKESWRLDSTLQEVFAKAFLEPARLAYDGLRPYKNYLLTIARNRVMDQVREEKPGRFDVRELSDIDEGEMVLDDHTRTPEQVAADQELIEQVRLFVSKLNPTMRRLFEVRFVESCSVDETAARLGANDYRVKRDEKRLKSQFFKFMRERGYFSGYGSTKGVAGTFLLCIIAVYGGIR